MLPGSFSQMKEVFCVRTAQMRDKTDCIKDERLLHTTQVGPIFPTQLWQEFCSRQFKQKQELLKLYPKSDCHSTNFFIILCLAILLALFCHRSLGDKHGLHFTNLTAQAQNMEGTASLQCTNMLSALINSATNNPLCRNLASKRSPLEI